MTAPGPHPFSPYANQQRSPGCVRCSYPKENEIHNPKPAITFLHDPPQPVSVAFAFQEASLPKTREEKIQTKGHKDDTGKTMWEVCPWYAMQEMAGVMTFGAQKYESYNYRKGMNWGRLWGAAIRHLWSWAKGEENDSESGKSHLAHCACCVLMLRDLQILKKGTDDRWKQ